MSASSLAKPALAAVIELDDPEKATPQLMPSLSISEPGGAETLVHHLGGRDRAAPLRERRS